MSSSTHTAGGGGGGSAGSLSTMKRRFSQTVQSGRPETRNLHESSTAAAAGGGGGGGADGDRPNSAVADRAYGEASGFEPDRDRTSKRLKAAKYVLGARSLSLPACCFAVLNTPLHAPAHPIPITIERAQPL